MLAVQCRLPSMESVRRRRLPPGQHAARLERFGLPQFAARRVDPPARPVITVTGEVRRPSQFDVAELIAGLPRREQRADLHCVATWSALDLTWAGVAFHRVVQRLEQVTRPHPSARWLLATGLDGFRSSIWLPDALSEEVLLADELDSLPLSTANGAPIRLIATAHYGYKSVKHLTALEYCSRYPGGSAGWMEHPRGRVAHEERSRYLPGPVWRRLWRLGLPYARRPYRVV